MNRRTRFLFALVCVLGLVLVPSLMAQTSNGTIAGTITDKTGGAVVKATVTATSQDLGTTLGSAITDGSGGYRIDALVPGKYTVSIKAAGFSEMKFPNVDVRGSYTTSVNAELEVGSVSATVVVEASAVQELQTQSGDLSKSFSQPEIDNLPYSNLNPISLVLTQAGVTGPAPVAGGNTNNSNFGLRTNGTQFVVNGTRPRANNFLIDGQDNNDNSIAGQAFQPDNGAAYGEVTILTNAYSAEYGRGGGSVTNVISKGGSNDFHGSAWELNRNTYYSAIPADQGFGGGRCSDPHPPICVPPNVGNPVDNENVFGYAFGGRIIRNKLFFFQTTQWDRDRVTANGSVLKLPTANGVATLQSLGPNANVNFLLAALNGLRGSSTNPAPSIDLGNGRGLVEMGFVERSGIGEVSNARTENVRVDWLAGEKDSFSARYIRSDSALTPDLFNFPSQLQPFDSQQGGPSQTIGTTWVHTFSPRAVNEFRASFTEINFAFSPTAATAANPLFSSPQISIAGLPALGFPSNLPQGRGHKTWQYQDALSYSIGKHTFKAGGDVAHLAVVDQIPFNSRGTITYAPCSPNPPATTCTFTALANFVDDFAGTGGAINKVFGSPVTKPFVTSYAPYVQDTWRVTTNFTLDLGMRYEYWGAPENTLLFPALNTSVGVGLPGFTLSNFPNMYASPQKSDLNNFAPRVGFAYTPRIFNRIFGHDKTVIRGGYGLFYDGLFTNILDNTGGANPNAVAFTSTSNTANNGRGIANATAVLAGAQAVLNPLGSVTTVASNFVNPLTHQWNLDIQRELPGGIIVTAAYVGTRGEHLFESQAFNPRVNGGARMNPNFGPVTVRDNAGDSIYHGAQLTVERKFSHGLLIHAAYTYSKLLDDGSDVFGPTGGNTINRNDFAQNPLCQKCERGPSIFDVRHRIVASYIWDLPYIHNSSNLFAGVVKAITRDWTISGTTTAQTGFAGTPFLGVDINGDGSIFNDRPIIVDPTKGKFDPARYGAPPKSSPYAGTIGRGSVEMPGFQNWDFAVQRAFKMPLWKLEGQRLALRGEAYNVFNHPNLGIPDLNLADANLGLASTIYGGRVLKIKLTYAF